MAGTRVPLGLYLTEAKAFVLHFATQKRWRECGADRSRWLKHFILVTGYMTMMTLIIVCIRWFQVDDSSWHFTSIFGYYATAVLLYLTVEMFLSRLKKKEDIHRFSEPTDWLFLVLLFFTTLTGIFMHMVRLAGWPMGTYVMYVIHLAIAVPMLVIEVPFGKWSHLFYRPLAIYLSTVREKARKNSAVDIEAVKADAGETLHGMHAVRHLHQPVPPQPDRQLQPPPDSAPARPGHGHRAGFGPGRLGMRHLQCIAVFTAPAASTSSMSPGR